LTTLNLQVAASTDDADQAGTVVSLGYTYAWFGNGLHSGFRFTGVSGLAGATINSAVLTFRAHTTNSDSFIGDWYAEDGASPSTFTTAANNITGRTRTTATCEGDASDFGNWIAGNDPTFSGDGAHTIAEIIQELAGSYDPTAIVLLWIFTSGTGYRFYDTWDHTTSPAPKLDIDYTAAIGVITLTPSPVTIPMTVPAPTLAFGDKTLTPDPVVINLFIPSVTIKPADTILTPDPVAISLVVPTPTVTIGIILTPDPVAVPLVIPTLSLTFGAKTLTPDPVAIQLVIPTVTVTGVGGITYDIHGVPTILNPAWFPPGTTFRLRVIMFTSAAVIPARARLYDLSSGLPISGSDVSTTSTSEIEVLSDEFSLPSGQRQYRVEFGGEAGGVFKCAYSAVRPVSP